MAQSSEIKLLKRFDQDVEITGNLTLGGNAIGINTDNFYLDGITKSGNTLTFSVNGATNQTYTFGSNAFTSYTNHATAGYLVTGSNGTNIGEVRFAHTTYSDPQPGVTRDAKFGDDGIAASEVYSLGKLVTAISNGAMISTGAATDAFGYNSNYGHYIKGAGTTYVYGNGSFYDGSTNRTLIHSGNIGSQSVSYATSAGNADTVDGYHSSNLWRSDGATWNPSANVILNQSANSQEWSFDIIRNGYSGGYWQVWDSSNSTMLKVDAVNGKVYAPYNFVGNLEGNASTASTASSVTWSNVSSKPASWLNNTVLIQEIAPSSTAFPSGFYQDYQGSGNPTGTWFNYINVRHSNVGNGHGYQLGMSYYDNNLWFRSYQGGTSPSFQSWETAIGSGNTNQTKSGYLQSNSSLRAPIFYDSNNTNWWIDPDNGSSAKFRQFVQIGDSSSYNTNSGSWGARLNVTDDVHARIDVAQDANGMHSYWYAHTGQSSIKFGTTSNHGVEFVSNNSGRGQITSGGTLEWWNNVTGKIYYDYDNTGYYLDPASTSNLNALNVGGSPVLREDNQNILRYRGSITSQDWNAYIDGTEGGWFRVLGMSGSNKPPAYTYGMALSMSYASQSKVQLYFPETGSSSNGIYVRTGWNTGYRDWRSIALHGVNPQTGGSLYADYFIDRNNTSYYLDPNATSNLYNLELSGAKHTYLYITPGNGYEAMVRFNGGQGSTWYVGSRTTTQLLGSQDAYHVYSQTAGRTVGGYVYSGHHYAYASSRAPIFYDLDNTGYYINPASTSSLSGLTVASQITGSVSGSSNSVAITGYGNGNFTFYQNSGTFDAFSGWHNYFIGNHGSGASYYHTMIAFPFWGPPRYSRREGGTLRGPYDFWTSERTIDSSYDIYAPVYYDKNDSSRYLDPSSTGTSIRVSGDIIAYYSDERLKDIEGNISDALNKVKSLNGFYYTPNEKAQKLGYKKKREVGLSAQEVEAILPELIKEAPVSPEYKTVDYAKLVPLLVEAIKEQQKQIDELKKLINP